MLLLTISSFVKIIEISNQLGSCLEKKLRLADRDSCKAQISKVTEDGTNKIEDLARKIMRSRKFNVDSGRCVKQSKSQVLPMIFF